MADSIYTKADGSSPKWSLILAQVMRDLESDRFAAQGRFHTIRELAVNYGVSVITAQRVFRELTARGLIETQGRLGTRVKRSFGGETVHVCLRDDHFSAPGGIRSFQTITTFLDGVKAGEEGLFADLKPIGFSFLQRNLKALAGRPVLLSSNVFLDVTPQHAALNMERLAQVTQAITPIIFHCFTELPGLSQVVCDLYRGIRQVVDHLAAAGHAEFGFFSGPLNNVWFRSRFQAFVDGLFSRNLPLLPERVKITSGHDRDEDFRTIAALLDLPRPPTALVCVNDSRALHVLEYCMLHGIAVPGTLAVTGFDNLPEGALSRPTLTSVDGRDHEMGRQCATLLRRRLQGDLKEPEIVRVEPQLIARESSVADEQAAAG